MKKWTEYGTKQRKVKNKPIVVIGDVHGRFNALKKLTAKLPRDAEVILVGDLIDRGPESVNVCQFVREKGWQVILGNHEWMMINAFENPIMMDLWLSNGGYKTLEDIENKANELNVHTNQIIDDLLSWFKRFPLYMEISLPYTSLLITHAGVKTGLSSWQEALSIPLDAPDSIIWYRGPLGDFEGITQICGHTPVPHGPTKEGNNWRIDTGCTYTHHGLGYLSAIIFYNNKPQPEILRVNCFS